MTIRAARAAILLVCVTTVAACSSDTCDAGWQLAADGSCEDIDECATNNGGCAQHCANTPVGSFTCSCDLGWDLDADGLSCNRDVCIPVCEADEKCLDAGVALDNDCDGLVDEGCTCEPGLRQACFMGDPAVADAPGCFTGYQACAASGAWGPCLGGAHATTGCYESDQTGCHALFSPPFVPVHLADGVGTFGADAITEQWTIICPQGVSPCPTPGGVMPTDELRPQQSGEYLITYTKTTGTGTDSCSYPLQVGAPGLRIELDWEHTPFVGSVDLDLHVHEPNDSTPWGGDAGSAVDCAYDNCTVSAFAAATGVDWFSGTAPPDAVDWYLDPTSEKNTCYFAPRGQGAEWQSLGMGCHNPRLDVDNINCDATVTNPEDYDFCTPENINIDFPPLDQWTRIGVHYYSNHGESYDVHPRVRVFCDGELAAELGPNGYYDPEVPVSLSAADSATRFWLVADVAYVEGTCGGVGCIVRPIFLDPETRTPYLTTVTAVQAAVGPAYPALP